MRGMSKRRWAAAALVLTIVGAIVGASAPVAGAESVLTPVPVQSTLPVLLEHGLDARHARAGQAMVARPAQCVPLGEGRYLPADAEVVGSVTAVGATMLTFAFTQICLHRAVEPVRVRLQAAAEWFEVEQTRDPLGGPTKSTGDWTTEQIGGDEVYGMNVAAGGPRRRYRRLRTADEPRAAGAGHGAFFNDGCRALRLSRVHSSAADGRKRLDRAVPCGSPLEDSGWKHLFAGTGCNAVNMTFSAKAGSRQSLCPPCVWTPGSQSGCAGAGSSLLAAAKTPRMTRMTSSDTVAGTSIQREASIFAATKIKMTARP